MTRVIAKQPAQLDLIWNHGDPYEFTIAIAGQDLEESPVTATIIEISGDFTVEADGNTATLTAPAVPIGTYRWSATWEGAELLAGTVRVNRPGVPGQSTVASQSIIVHRGANVVQVTTTGAQRGPAGVGVPAGGGSGQALVKASGSDFDTEWSDIEGGGGISSVGGGTGIDIDTTDPANPVVAVDVGELGLATVATSGAYGDLSGRPTLGTAAAAATTDFDPAGTAGAVAGDLEDHASATTTAHGGIATSSQGALADTAVQPGDLATVATSGDYEDLDNIPAPGIVAFDAAGNASAARPSVPTSTIVLWIDVPSEPTNLGPFDLWEDGS